MSALLVELHADEIAEAAASFDGHVTHGSLDALLKVVTKLCIEAQRSVLRDIHQLSYETKDCAQFTMKVDEYHGKFEADHPQE